MSADSTRELLNRLSVAPVRLRALLATLPEAALRAPPSTGGFAPIEDAWHLRDLEAEGHFLRIRRILAEERPVLTSIDGDQLALERQYLERELGSALDEFAQYREASLGLLGGLTEEAWSRTAVFEDRPITLRELVINIAAHDESHLGALSLELTGTRAHLDSAYDPALAPSTEGAAARVPSR